jgi:2-polyprenyl-6-methoxyphenol hydroxylase-like FAD-dependent oxidoreductase
LSKVQEPLRISYLGHTDSRYFPIVLNEMEKVGIFDDVIKASIPNKEGIWFRTPYTKSNEVLATMKVAKIPKGGLRYNFVATNLGQDELAALILSHAEKLDTFDIRWSHRFAGLKQDENGVTVCAVTPKGEKFFHADYVIACDGAGSAVRRSLCIPFEGITWDVWIPTL